MQHCKKVLKKSNLKLVEMNKINVDSIYIFHNDLFQTGMPIKSDMPSDQNVFHPKKSSDPKILNNQ